MIVRRQNELDAQCKNAQGVAFPTTLHSISACAGFDIMNDNGRLRCGAPLPPPATATGTPPPAPTHRPAPTPTPTPRITKPGSPIIETPKPGPQAPPPPPS